MVELSVEQLAPQFWKLANWTVRTSTVYLLFAAVQVFFFVLNAIQLYEQCTIKPKGGFYSHVVFNSTFQVLTKFHKVCTKSLFCFWKKWMRKMLSACQKKTTVINVFSLNKLNFQNCFFLAFQLCMKIKSLAESQLWGCTISSKLSPLLVASVLFRYFS